MRIICVYNQRLYSKRAHDVFIMKNCESLARAGEKVHLIVGRTESDEKRLLAYYGLSPHPNLTIQQVPILRMRGRIRPSWHMIYNLSCLAVLRRLIRQGRADIICLSGIKLTNFLLTFGWLLSVPLVYEVHGLYEPYTSKEKGRKDKREERLFSRVDGLIVTTEALKRALNEVYAVSVPLTRVPLGCDPPPEAPALLPRHSPPEIFYIGQLYPLQGVDLLIEAMKYIKYARLNIVGGKEEEIASLKALAERLEVDRRAIFHGFVEPRRAKKKMARADVLVLPSRSQGRMPYVAHLKLFEYMVAGRPIVATNLPSISEFVRDGESAILVEPNNVVSLSLGIKRVLEDEALAQRLAQNAFEAARKFTWEARARALADFFRSIAERRREELNVRTRR